MSKVPGLRYMAPLVWLIVSDRPSIVKALRERGRKSESRSGGMVGMVPDGILGAFRTQPGVDSLLIGRKRGLMRICTEEGATCCAAWCFGTTDILSVVQDPWGLLESISRRMKAALLGYYGRWGLPIPRRMAVSILLNAVKAEKIANPTAEQVEKLHREVYDGLQCAYDKQKAYAGYPDRTLRIE